jgi:hypothetical protein
MTAPRLIEAVLLPDETIVCDSATYTIKDIGSGIDMIGTATHNCGYCNARGLSPAWNAEFPWVVIDALIRRRKARQP